MKNQFFVTILIAFVFISCEKKAIHEYYIKNNCEEIIVVDILDLDNKFLSIEVAPDMEELIYTGKTINDVYKDEITSFIKELKIKKGNVIFKWDPLDYRIWQYDHISRLEAKSYLIVNPEDFEDE